MQVNFLVTRKWLLVFSLVFLIVAEARADVRLTDNFSVAGLLRQELAVHTGEKNPNLTALTERNTINLSRTFFHTEWTYKPNDTFKLFSKVKLISDQTYSMDSRLNDYNAFPLATPRYGGYLRASDDNSFDAEMSELYADVSLGNLWVRLGKQQIVWGEIIGGRILDQINPLDQSWHFSFEPEEYENIRMAQWALRARYNMPQEAMPLSWLSDAYLEGFVNPGDIAPTVNPAIGAPYRLSPAPSPMFRTQEFDRRDKAEFGFRVGGKIGQFAGTLNYLNLYTDSGFWTSRMPVGPPSPANPFPTDVTYPKIELYGISVNYAFPEPINTTVTYEATYSPDEPYYIKGAALPAFRTAHTLKQAIIFAKSAFIFPRPISAMSVQFQYSETQIWDNNLLQSTPAPFSSGSNSFNNNVDADQHIIALVLSQDLWHNNINVSLKMIYDLDDAHWITPGFKYKQGDHWIYDIYVVAIGGPESRPGRLGGLSWANEVFGRITYQF